MDSFLSLYPTVVDLMETFSPIVENGESNKYIPLADVLAILPRLQPRLYSISSSSMTSPTVVEISVGVVHAHTNDGVHIKGVCSNYLASLMPMNDRACISIRTSSFRGPVDIVNTPMIMVGAGTGLAPMIGFLEVRL
jgi:sulfite reductase alpha subunit-like flavoprotein